MDIDLICNTNMNKIIKEILLAKGFIINKDSKIVLVEKGMEKSINNSIYITFNPNDLNSLMDFLEEIKKSDDKSNLNFITLKGEENFEMMPLEKIQFFEADNNDVYCIVDGEKKIYRVKDKLYELEEKLDKNIFIRISKSNIVNILNISQVIPWFASKLLLKFKGTTRNLEVTRSYSKIFKDHLGM